MGLQFTYDAPEAAAADLAANGFADRGSYWTKMSTMDPFFGGAVPAIVVVEHRRVDHGFGSDYWELRFA